MGGGDTVGEERILWGSHDEGDCIIWRYWHVSVCNKGWETTLFFFGCSIKTSGIVRYDILWWIFDVPVYFMLRMYNTRQLDGRKRKYSTLVLPSNALKCCQTSLARKMRPN